MHATHEKIAAVYCLLSLTADEANYLKFCEMVAGVWSLQLQVAR